LFTLGLVIASSVAPRVLTIVLAFTFLINEMFGKDIFLLANHFALD
jgi:hypothetical protein